MRRLPDTTIPLLIAFFLALPACHSGPFAADRAYSDAGQHSQGSGLAAETTPTVAAQDAAGVPEDPSRDLVSFAPPPFTAIYPTSLGPAYRALERYYEAHASERAGRCLVPYVDGITNTQVVENTSERLVVDIRYLYRDRVRTDTSPSCIGYGARRFVLARNGHGLDVEEMSGPRRN